MKTPTQHISANFFGASKPSRTLVSKAIAAITIGLTCASAQAADLTLNETDYLNYQLPAEVSEVCSAHDNCPSVDVRYLNSSQEWLNEWVNERMNEWMLTSNRAMLEEYQSPFFNYEDTPALRREIAETFDKVILKSQQAMPADHHGYYDFSFQADYVGHVAQFEIIELNSYEYTGGAHGMPMSEYLVFDTNTQRPISLDDLIKSDKQKKFEDLAYTAYKDWVKTFTATTDEAKAYEESWPFTMTENFTLDKKGIILKYQAYAIAPYSSGQPTLTIPYKELSDIIEPDAIEKTKYSGSFFTPVLRGLDPK